MERHIGSYKSLPTLKCSIWPDRYERQTTVLLLCQPMRTLWKQIPHLRAATDESQKTRNKKQETKRFSTFAVYRLRHSETKQKNIAWFENQVLAEHVRKSQSTIYLKSHGCVHGFQNEVLLINFSTMFCKPCSLSRNRSLRDAKSARHMFVWFAKHCLAEHCLLFRGDADECQKQFCFVFRICLAFFDSRLWRP